MNVRIGLTYSSKEIEVELPEDTKRDEVKRRIEEALKSGDALWLTDRKGREIAVPADKIAYVELGSPSDDRRIGFGA